MQERFYVKQSLIGFCFLLALNGSLGAQTAVDIWKKMQIAVSNIKTASYELTVEERLGSKTSVRVSDFRILSSPFKLYGRNIHTGVEFLFVEGWNNNKAYVNPNGFPWVNLSLDIYGKRIRDGMHHTIDHAGFGYMNNMLKALEKKIIEAGYSPEKCIKLNSEVTWNGRPCYRLQIDAPNYEWIDYSCPKDETLFSLCSRLNILEYAVMENNKLDYGASLSKGKVIKIPNFMAQKIVLYIDKENYLPIVQMIYDDKGLYEKYEYRKLELNIKVADNEWTPQCAGYGF